MNRPLPSPLARILMLILVVGLAGPSTLSAQQALPVSSITRSQPQTPHPLDPALKMTRDSLKYMQQEIHDYTALFVKRCRVGGELSPMTYAEVKILNPRPQRRTPMSVYLKFLKPSSVRGREVIWVDGRNEGKLIAHESGFKNFVSLKLDPNGYLAMRGQRRPITRRARRRTRPRTMMQK